jgi:peroxiredoxin Q/BCP
VVIEVGQMAPDISLPATTGGEVALSSLYAKAPVVVAFYPRDDTPG